MQLGEMSRGNLDDPPSPESLGGQLVRILPPLTYTAPPWLLAVFADAMPVRLMLPSLGVTIPISEALFRM